MGELLPDFLSGVKRVPGDSRVLDRGYALNFGELRQCEVRHGRHVWRSPAGLQADQGRLPYVSKLGRLLLRKTELLPKYPQLHRDRLRHQFSSCSKGRGPREPRPLEPTPARNLSPEHPTPPGPLFFTLSLPCAGGGLLLRPSRVLVGHLRSFWWLFLRGF